MKHFLRVLLLLWRRFKGYKDISVPVPAVLRKDLLYGYYGCSGDQLAETIDHISVYMDAQWEGLDKTIANINTAKLPTILDVSQQVFIGPAPYKLRDDAGERLHALFVSLRGSDALAYVKYLYPIDEPNNTVVNATELARAIEIIREVAAMYMSEVKLCVIYAAGRDFSCQHLFDYVGFDDYEAKSSLLKSDYPSFKKSLLTGQKTILVPGGAYGHDITPWINFAHSNEEVGMVLPFIWFDGRGVSGTPELGIRSLPYRENYIAAGNSTKS